MLVKPVGKISGEFNVPGDKSISHRAVMLSSLADGTSEIRNFLNSDDCKSTVNAFKAMGVDIEFVSDTIVKVKGSGLRGLRSPQGKLY